MKIMKIMKTVLFPFMKAVFIGVEILLVIMWRRSLL